MSLSTLGWNPNLARINSASDGTVVLGVFFEGGGADSPVSVHVSASIVANTSALFKTLMGINPDRTWRGFSIRAVTADCYYAEANVAVPLGIKIPVGTEMYFGR